MVLGLTRTRTRFGPPATRPFDETMRPHNPARQWLAERGEILFEASCGVVGGFPGFADRGGRLDDTRLRISERYLLVGDGDDAGFGLLIREIDGVALVACLDRDDHGLRVFYRDEVSPRTFTIQFHGNRLSLRSGPRAERAHLSLLRAGLADRFAAAPPLEPNFVVPWDQTAEIETENVLWAGRANAPRQVGLESAVCNVWLTTRSLIWGCESVDGVHRIPHSLLTDVAAAVVIDRVATPAVYVGIGDASSGHFDLAFLFDQQSTADHNLRERGAFLVGLRSRGIPVGTPTPPSQPWRAGAIHGRLEEISFDEDRIAAADEAPPAWSPPPKRRRRLGSIDVAPDQASAPASDLVLAEWASLPDDETGRHDDVQLSAGWAWREAWSGGRRLRDDGRTEEMRVPAVDDDDHDDVATAVLATADTRERTDDAADKQTDDLQTASCWPQASSYESAVVGALAEALEAIRERASGTSPTPLHVQVPAAAEQQAAIAELTELHRSGVIALDELRARTVRLVALGDACVRLRTLIELRDAGHVSDTDLARRQRAITGQLATTMDVR